MLRKATPAILGGQVAGHEVGSYNAYWSVLPGGGSREQGPGEGPRILPGGEIPESCPGVAGHLEKCPGSRSEVIRDSAGRSGGSLHGVLDTAFAWTVMVLWCAPL